jgi:hypothetical protein
VQAPQALQVAHLLGERVAGAVALARERAREQSDEQQRARVRAPERERHRARERLGRLEQQRDREADRAERGSGVGALPPEEQRGVDRDRDVQEREDRVGAAREVHQCADEPDVDGELRAGEGAQSPHARESRRGQDRRGEGRDDRLVEPGVEVVLALARALRGDEERADQDREREREPPGEQPGEARSQRRARRRPERRFPQARALPYFTASAILKIGRYIAIRMVPTLPPRNTIMSGSSIEVSAETALSISSS